MARVIERNKRRRVFLFLFKERLTVENASQIEKMSCMLGHSETIC
jgi:hypothetical protein